MVKKLYTGEEVIHLSIALAPNNSSRSPEVVYLPYVIKVKVKQTCKRLMEVICSRENIDMSRCSYRILGSNRFLSENETYFNLGIISDADILLELH
mmetsp:Transcript_16716/g.25111  ORF Transcript_16716/g.25111 Transcript_16716/m.25111 type:complete len:96 (+) Transcript_16716:141-428(+)